MSKIDRTHRQLNCSLFSYPNCVRVRCMTTQPTFVGHQSSVPTVISNTANTNRLGYVPDSYANRSINAISATTLIVSDQEHVLHGAANQSARKKCLPLASCTVWSVSNRLVVLVTILSVLLFSVGAIESDSCEPKILNKAPPDPVSLLQLMHSLLICVLASIEALDATRN